jgi:hypothetical protein
VSAAEAIGMTPYQALAELVEPATKEAVATVITPRAHRLSASKRRLAMACLYWARGDVTVPDSESSAGADLGSALHEAASDEIDGLDRLITSTPEDLERLAEKWELSDKARDTLRALHATWSAWWSAEISNDPGWRTEIPFAYDAQNDTANELQKGDTARAYVVGMTQLPGTIDIHRVEGKRGWVLDIKTGRPPKLAADHLEQLLHGAVCLQRIYGLERVTVGIVHVMTDRVKPDTVELDAFDIETAAAEMRAELARIAGAEPKPGVHCKECYCPAKAVCPSTQRALSNVLPMFAQEPRSLPVIGEIQTDDEARWLYETRPLIEAWLVERGAAIKAYADKVKGLRFPDGRVYSGQEAKRDTLRLDVAGAEDALRSVLGDAVSEAIDRKVTAASVERAARKVAARGQLGAMRDDAIDAMRKAGAVKRSKFTEYRLRKAGE